MILLKKYLNKILLPFFGVSLFFLLLVGPLLYYSFSPSFYVAHGVKNNLVSSNQQMNYVQNVYEFIQ